MSLSQFFLFNASTYVNSQKKGQNISFLLFIFISVSLPIESDLPKNCLKKNEQSSKSCSAKANQGVVETNGL